MSILNIIEGVALAFLLTSILFTPAILTWASQRRRTQVLIALGFTALFAAFSVLTLYSWSQEDWSTAKPKSLEDELGAIGIYLVVSLGYFLLRKWQIARQPIMSVQEVDLIRRDYRLRITLFTAFLLLALVSPHLVPSIPGGSPVPLEVSSSATAPPALPTPVVRRATASVTPHPGDVLYRADWSGGLGAWSASADWSVMEGMLVNSGALPAYTWEATESEAPTLLAPFQLGQVTDYAVIAHIQVTLNPFALVSNVEPSFGFLTAGSVSGPLLPVWSGDRIGVFVSNVDPQRVAIWTNGQISTPLSSAPIDLGATQHSYRIEVRGKSLTLLVDGTVMCQAIGSGATRGDEWIGLWSAHVPLTLRDFTIVAL